MRHLTDLGMITRLMPSPDTFVLPLHTQQPTMLVYSLEAGGPVLPLSVPDGGGKSVLPRLRSRRRAEG